MTISSTVTRPATKWSAIPVAAALMLLASGCAPTVVAPAPAIDCAGWKKIQLYQETVAFMTDEEALDIAAHNDYGRELGCWK